MGSHARRSSRRAAGALGLLALVTSLACETHTGPLLDEKAPQGALVGGVAGAADDPAVGGHEHDAAGILAGGAAGAEAGGLVGNYLDDQARRVQDAVPDAQVQRQGDRLLVTLPGDILFDSATATLQPGGYERLRSLAHTLNEYPDTDVVVKGYTDSQGPEAYNLQLSEERADHVLKYLVSESVAASRLTSIGFGPQFPVASNDTPEGRQQNRRVEFELKPDQGLRDREAAGATR